MDSSFLHAWPLIFAADLTRYVVGVAAVYFPVWVWWRQPLLARRIQARWPVTEDVKREVTYSLLTVLIFSIIGYGLFLGIRSGALRVYSDIAHYGWLWWATSVVLLVVLHDAYFYWTHRLLHHPSIFRWAHRTHHRSHTPTPWAAYAFAPPEAVVQAAYLPLILTILPAHGSALFLFLVHMILRNAIGHCGFELMPRRLARWTRWQPITTVTHHDLHHSTTHWNYGLYFTWWDRLMKTQHPHYDERLQAVWADGPGDSVPGYAGIRPLPESTDRQLLTL